MALYINSTANIFEIEGKEAKNGKTYVSCNVVFYSKSKDKNGKFTKEDAPFTIRGVAFGSAASYLLDCKDDEKVFVTVSGKLADSNYEKDGKKQYAKRLNIFTVTEFDAHKKAADEDVTDDDFAQADV